MLASLPLTGKRVLVTRAAHQAESFVRLLETQGATAVTCPLIEIVSAAELASIGWLPQPIV